jgi:AraC family transcriptional regulator of adaptative response / DNA-3-methyladenine glycosylase II
LRQARKLLVTTDLPIIEVAFASGFESVRRFNALFREQFDQTPSEMRRAIGPPARAKSAAS